MINIYRTTFVRVYYLVAPLSNLNSLWVKSEFMKIAHDAAKANVSQGSPSLIEAHSL